MKNMGLMQIKKLTYHETFTFHYNGTDIVFPHFVHWYNKTWSNCRAIEIPVFQYLLRQFRCNRVLEVGNVLGHYQKISHDVLDKYEMRQDVINSDVVFFNPEDKYDVVLSCSTLEHVGFDEPEKDEMKFIKAVTNIQKNILTKHGMLFCSVPVGYNPFLDTILYESHVVFDRMWCYHRLYRNVWVRSTFKDLQGCVSGDGLIFGVLSSLK